MSIKKFRFHSIKENLLQKKLYPVYGEILPINMNY